MNLLLTGVGGQGAILFSKILSYGLLRGGFDVKMSEIHGMSQRGGTVTTQIKYGEKIYAPNIGEAEADVIVAFEKMEALRALPYLRRGGMVLADVREIPPMPVLTGAALYPHDALEALAAAGAEVTVIPAADIAAELGNLRAQNMVLLGALARRLDIPADWRELIRAFAPRKAAELNVLAYERGFAL
jgi:indolepyruvate ferredoxin oxidoreductase beta subunit